MATSDPSASSPQQKASPVESVAGTNRFRDRLRLIWRTWTHGLALAPVGVLVVSTVVLILFHDNCASSVFTQYLAKFFPKTSFSGLYSAFYWYGCSFVVLGFIPYLLGRTFFRMSVSELGVGLGDWKFGLKAALGLYVAFLPILIGASFLPDFQSKYPLFSEARNSSVHFAVYQVMYAVYFIGWEFVFRGFMLFGLRSALGYYAVFIQMIPFAIMHFGKPQIETLSAVLAGILLGYLALRTRSFWYGWLLHSLVAISNDVLAVWHKST